MKIAIITICLILIVFLVLNKSKRPIDIRAQIGNTNDIEVNLGKLMMSPKEDSFLIIKIYGTENFIQFTGDSDGVQLDFPLVTENHKAMEDSFRTVAKGLGLKIDENKGSDGSRFLDIDINGNISEISNIVESFVEKLFNVTQSTELEFELNV